MNPANKLPTGNDGERAVSPVIGVILMVAITVILAAVIGTFVLGLGDSLSNQAPQASWSVNSVNTGDGDTTNDGVEIVHKGGDEVDPANLEITVDGTTHYNDGSTQGVANFAYTDNFDDPVTAANSLQISESADEIAGEVTVRVIWEDPDSGSTSILTDRQVTLDT